MSAKKPIWSLLALAAGAFAVGTTEFAPMGLLPVIAEGVGVNIPTAGMLITAYAIGVMLGAPVMTLAFGRLRVKKSLLCLMAIFVLGNVLAALAPGFWTLFAARLVTSLNHGAFFGLGSVLAAQLVPKDKQASAVATMLMGLTIANIGGVPVATWIGHQIGWRMAFAGTAGLGLLAMAALAWALPRGEAGEMPNLRKEVRVLVQPEVLLTMATTVLGSGAMFTLYTYVAPTLTTITHASAGFITLALVMFVLPLLLPSEIGALVGMLVWGAATFAIVPPAQMRVMHAAAGAPGLASSVNVGAFNLGNALGAVIGGGVISAGLGYAALPVAGGLLAAGGLLLVMAATARRRVAALDPA